MVFQRSSGVKKILIFGNSGSGKSTLAKQLCRSEQLAHLDLDTLAWKPATPPARKPLAESAQEIADFINSHEGWVIEGCYADLLEIAAPHANEVLFMNLPVEACIANAKSRPWEPHKYESLEAQNANLEMLISWIAQYPQRNDTFSEASHRELYEKFRGKKTLITSNNRNI
jgi:adenylate kinase family enzyme